MPDIPVETAIERAREVLALGREIPARAVQVTRLDLPGKAYYLVGFGTAKQAEGVAAVDAKSGEVLTHARLSGPEEQSLLSPAEARRRAGEPEGGGSPRLVWRPCRISFSMLFPFWEVSTAAGNVYVDHRGNSWTELDASARGGS